MNAEYRSKLRLFDAFGMEVPPGELTKVLDALEAVEALARKVVHDLRDLEDPSQNDPSEAEFVAHVEALEAALAVGRS